MHAVRVTVICDECVRIEYAPFGPSGEPGKFCDYPSLFAIHGPAGDEARVPDMGLATRVFTTSADAGSTPIEFATGSVRFSYVPDGKPPHAGNMHALIEHPGAPEGVERRRGMVVWTPGARNRFNLGGTLSTLDGLRGPLPLGEGLLARDGWHVVDDSRRHLLVDGWAATRESEGLGANTDWYLFGYGDDYASALRAMTIVAGRVPMPRKCMLGSWYSRFWPYTSDEFRGIVDEYEVHGFPLDVLVLDMDWHKAGWTGWSWNRELIPDPEALLSWMHARGLAVTLNLHPADGVGPHEDRYAAFMHAIGREPNGETAPFDAGDRRYMGALFEQVMRPLEETGEGGVDFWWVDWQQSKFVRSIPGLTNLRWLNHLFFEHTKGLGIPGQRGASFSRWAADDLSLDPDAGTEWGHPTTGGWGDHRYPIHFSGDAHVGWAMLQFQVPFTSAAGNIGCFFWSHDIGGHFGPRLEETATRWVQFGALSPVLRLHSARTAALDRRPWTYETMYCDAMRRAFALRSRLMPLLYTAVRACHEEALPLVRPMYLGWPREENAYQSPEQYMLGEDLLAAPVVSAGMGARKVATQRVWFPPLGASEGAGQWYDLETGEGHTGSTQAIVAADIDRTPLFVRGGALLPMQPPTHRMGSEPIGHLIVRCYPGSPGEVVERWLYEDDGLTLDHERGGSARTSLRAVWSASGDGTGLVLEASIGPTVGEFTGQPQRRTLEIQIGSAHRVIAVVGMGGAGDATLRPDEAGGLAVVRMEGVDIRERRVVRVEFEAADPRLNAQLLRRQNLSAAMDGGLVEGEPRPLGGARLREAVIELCRADKRKPGRDAERRRACLLAIGAGIDAKVEAGSVRLIDSLAWIDGGNAEVEFVDCLGERERVVGTGRCSLRPSGDHARDASIELPRQEMASPVIGLRASRVARFRFAIDEAPMAIEAVVRTALAPLTEFLVAGPFGWDWRTPLGDAVFDPERAAVDPGASFAGRDGRVRWREAERGPKWDVDLRASLGTRGGLAYAATTVLAPAACDAVLHLECGDKLEAFVNGVKVITLDDHSAHGAIEPRACIQLRAGANELLIKTTDGGGGWGFMAALECDRPLTHARPRGSGASSGNG